MTIDEKALQKADEHFHLITGHSIAWSANVPRKIIEAYLSALPPSPATAEGWRPTHRHRNGGFYRKIGEGFIEATMTEATIYESVDRRIWVRPTAQFNDGRFAPLAATPAQEG